MTPTEPPLTWIQRLGWWTVPLACLVAAMWQPASQAETSQGLITADELVQDAEGLVPPIDDGA